MASSSSLELSGNSDYFLQLKYHLMNLQNINLGAARIGATKNTSIEAMQNILLILSQIPNLSVDEQVTYNAAQAFNNKFKAEDSKFTAEVSKHLAELIQQIGTLYAG